MLGEYVVNEHHPKGKEGTENKGSREENFVTKEVSTEKQREEKEKRAGFAQPNITHP